LGEHTPLTLATSTYLALFNNTTLNKVKVHTKIKIMLSVMVGWSEHWAKPTSPSVERKIAENETKERK